MYTLITTKQIYEMNVLCWTKIFYDRNDKKEVNQSLFKINGINGNVILFYSNKDFTLSFSIH